MEIQAKGTGKHQTISPKEWAKMEQLGTDSEYDIIERDTIWAEQIDSDGKPTGLKQEYEKGHWENMLAHPKRLLWRSIDQVSDLRENARTKTNNIATPQKKPKENEPKSKIAGWYRDNTVLSWIVIGLMVVGLTFTLIIYWDIFASFCKNIFLIIVDTFKK